MDQAEKDAGTITALMLRLTEDRLPRARRLLEKVNCGDKFSESDIGFLKRVYEESRSNESLYQRHPEFWNLVTGFTALYVEIITKGMENEKLP